MSFLVSISALYQHALCMNPTTHQYACGCGQWHGDTYHAWVDHLPLVRPAGTLTLDTRDAEWLHKMKISSRDIPGA